MLQGVIFDLDGLMFDTENLWGSFWEPALAELGRPCPQGLAEAVRGTAGEAMREVVRRYCGEDCPAEKVIEIAFRIAAETFKKPVPKKPGLDSLLAYLKAQGLPLAVASSSQEDTVRTHLKNGGIEPYFDVVISGGMTARSKPAPDIFLLAAERLGVEPEKCLVLEDSYNGVRAGRAGGFVTVMVPDLAPANEEMRALADRICVSLVEVRERLENGTLL